MVDRSPTEKKLISLRNKRRWTKFWFIAFSAVTWLVIKLSYTYSEKLEYTVLVKSNSPEVVIANPRIPITVQVSSTGFNLLRQGLKLGDEIVINVDVANAKDKSLFLNLQNKQNYIAQELGDDLKISNILPGGILLNLDVLDRKKVPLKANVALNLPASFNLYGDVQLTPDEVEVYAPKELIDDLSIIETDVIEVHSDKEYQFFNVDVKFPEGMDVSLNPKRVGVKARILPFTEKIIQVPVQKINVPLDSEVKLFPSSITVKCNVALLDYDNIDASDFICLADMSQAEGTKSRIQLELSQVPEFVKVIDWGDKSVEYLMIE